MSETYDGAGDGVSISVDAAMLTQSTKPPVNAIGVQKFEGTPGGRRGADAGRDLVLVLRPPPETDSADRDRQDRSPPRTDKWRVLARLLSDGRSQFALARVLRAVPFSMPSISCSASTQSWTGLPP